MIIRTIPARMLLFLTTLISAFSLSAEDRFTSTIQIDPKTETTSIRIRIPKVAHAESIQSVYLQQKSAKGLDIHIPIGASEDAEGYSVFMVLPTSIASKAIIEVTHNRAITPNSDGSVTINSFVQGGESYKISLAQPKNNESEQGVTEPLATVGELRTKEDEKGVLFTTRNENLTAMAAKTDDRGKISQSYYFRGYWIWTIIGWTKEALKEHPQERLFQQRMVGGRTNKDKPLGLGFAFLRRGQGKEVFHVSHDGEIIDAYYVAENNKLTPLSDEAFEAYIKEREASRE